MYNSACLRYFGDNVASVEILPLFYGDMCLPLFLFIKKIYTDTAGDKCAGGLCDTFQRTLDAVKDIIEDARSESYRDSVAAGYNFLTWVKPRRLFVNLDRCQILIQCDDFAYELLFSHIDHFGHAETGISLQIDDGAVNAVDLSSFNQCRHLLKT